MKRIGILLIFLSITVSAMAQWGGLFNTNRYWNPRRPLFPDDPKGLKLPPGEPRAVDAYGNVIWIDEDYTTEKYRDAAIKLVIAEANKVAKELKLDEQLPICESNITEAWVGPFGNNYLNQCVGNIWTRNYAYYMSVGNSFSYLDDLHLNQDCIRYRMQYTWPLGRMDTNQAYQLATQWLNAVSMDVKGLNRDCALTVAPYAYFPSPKGEFVPVYSVSWTRWGVHYGDSASVIVCTPEKKLISLRVEDPRYILRKPIIFTNLDALLPGPTKIFSPPNLPSPARPAISPTMKQMNTNAASKQGSALHDQTLRAKSAISQRPASSNLAPPANLPKAMNNAKPVQIAENISAKPFPAGRQALPVIEEGRNSQPS